ncbi:hypothetical protein SAMN04487765_3019 [Tenacibaculum sp. MAR_2010_89]|uniref:hypothetical protein n=1 Tax=Tenacibaculum sp. MAR_2010_89 TaxID=1250198 RepID=UPI00089B8D1E|nr:hypothetical protein [Tenacibaculum sp. MAR_2010_89]SEE54064.1 hypothetical protein SAMN04487765_3019 [Tenacibaculum sp. MAR_2010_89]
MIFITRLFLIFFFSFLAMFLYKKIVVFKKVSLLTNNEINEGENEKISNRESIIINKLSYSFFLFSGIIVLGTLGLVTGNLLKLLILNLSVYFRVILYVLFYMLLIRIPFGMVNRMNKEVIKNLEKTFFSLLVISSFVLSIVFVNRILVI